MSAWDGDMLNHMENEVIMQPGAFELLFSHTHTNMQTVWFNVSILTLMMSNDIEGHDLVTYTFRFHATFLLSLHCLISELSISR